MPGTRALLKQAAVGQGGSCRGACGGCAGCGGGWSRVTALGVGVGVGVGAGAVLPPPQARPEEGLMSTSSAPPASAFLHSVLPKGEQAVSSPLAFQNLAAIFVCVCLSAYICC